MDKKLQEIQEQAAFMQAEIAQLSEELYAQQKDITVLRMEIAVLTAKLQSTQESGILRPDEDVPPPHY
ncbi:MAG: SlyX family protein [Alphaproteobacteria bacterium]|jgi:SlyX protein|tara:strand:- start:2291 stop:2494 length:204 start_codon:yes stop_codon:yes gene_type:complete